MLFVLVFCSVVNAMELSHGCPARPAQRPSIRFGPPVFFLLDFRGDNAEVLFRSELPGLAVPGGASFQPRIGWVPGWN